MTTTYVDYLGKGNEVLKTKVASSRDLAALRHRPIGSVAVTFYNIDRHLILGGETQSQRYREETIRFDCMQQS